MDPKHRPNRQTLSERADQLRAQAASLEARARSAEKKRSTDLRNCQARQIGYWALDLLKRGEPIPRLGSWEELVHHLDAYLVPDAHRAYFGLPPLPEDQKISRRKSWSTL